MQNCIKCHCQHMPNWNNDCAMASLVWMKMIFSLILAIGRKKQVRFLVSGHYLISVFLWKNMYRNIDETMNIFPNERKYCVFHTTIDNLLHIFHKNYLLSIWNRTINVAMMHFKPFWKFKLFYPNFQYF